MGINDIEVSQIASNIDSSHLSVQVNYAWIPSIMVYAYSSPKLKEYNHRWVVEINHCYLMLVIVECTPFNRFSHGVIAIILDSENTTLLNSCIQFYMLTYIPDVYIQSIHHNK